MPCRARRPHPKGRERNLSGRRKSVQKAPDLEKNEAQHQVFKGQGKKKKTTRKVEERGRNPISRTKEKKDRENKKP